MSVKLTLGALLIASAGFGAGYFVGEAGSLRFSNEAGGASSGLRAMGDPDPGGAVVARGANAVLYAQELADLSAAGLAQHREVG